MDVVAALFRAMGVFISQPWLALVPASALAFLYTLSKRRVVAAAATLWVIYAVYEYAMLRRWLCTGECNIRVDLLLFYPILIIMTIFAIIAGVNGLRHGARAH